MGKAKCSCMTLAAVAGGVLCLASFATADQTGTAPPSHSTATQASSPTGNLPPVSDVQTGSEGRAPVKGEGTPAPYGGPRGSLPEDECATAPLVAVPSTTSVNLTTCDTVPSDPVYSCHFSGPTQGVNTAWFRFVATGTQTRIHTCNSVAPADDSLLAVYTGSCTSLTEVCCNDDACGASTFLSDICCTTVAGTQYYIQIAAWSTGDVGTYTMEIASPCAPPCDVTCPPGSLNENEPVCTTGYVDNFNGGCNSTPNVFTNAACNQTWCGEYGGFVNSSGGNSRDTDWYRLTIGAATQLTATVTGEGTSRVFILTGVCPTTVIVTNTAAPCAPATATAAVSPGTYFIFAGTNTFGPTPTPCGADYTLQITCGAPAVGACCVFTTNTCVNGLNEADCTAQGGAWQGANTNCSTVECCFVVCNGRNEGCVGDSCPSGPYSVEANCGLPTDTCNGGCNAANEFSPLCCGDVICGTYGATGSRDTDWFSAFLTVASDVTWELTGEGPTLGFIIQPGSDPLDPCAGLVILTSGTADPCATVTLNASVGAGEIWTWAGTSVFTGVACGAGYEATFTCGTPEPGACCLVATNTCVQLAGGDCAAQGGIFAGAGVSCLDADCCFVTCLPGKTPENEPNCGLPTDSVNGGCNSTPEIYSPIVDGQAYCSTGAFDGSTRDTDWYQFTLTAESQVTYCLTAEFNCAMFILSGPCSAIVVEASAVASPCTETCLTACLPAGTYTLFAGASFDFGNVPCGAGYNMDLDIQTPCAPPCDVVCDPDKISENEPNCGLPTDTVNGGCNSTPPVYFNVNCGDDICGTYAFDGSTRDTDWYQLNHAGGQLDWCVVGEAATAYAILSPGPNGCADLVVHDFQILLPCVSGCISLNLPAGTYWLFAAPDFQGLVNCGAEYNASVVCVNCPCDPPGPINPDRDGDCDVDSTDLNIVLTDFDCPNSSPPPCEGDADGDGDTDSTDLNIILTSLPCP